MMNVYSLKCFLGKTKWDDGNEMKIQGSNPVAQRKALKEKNEWLAIKRTLQPHFETKNAQKLHRGRISIKGWPDRRKRMTVLADIQNLRCLVKNYESCILISILYGSIIRHRSFGEFTEQNCVNWGGRIFFYLFS